MKLKILLISAFVVFIKTASFAGVEFHIYPNTSILGPFVTFQNINKAESDFVEYPNRYISMNEDVVPTGLAMVNTLGYPNGRYMIKTFPHFEFGASAGAGVYKLNRKDNYSKDNPEIPGGGVNGAFHAGTGLSDDLDITFKFFSLGWFYQYDKSFDQTKRDETGNISRKFDLEVTESDILSFGVKTRYNLIAPSANASRLFSFGGLNINFGLDYMKARLSARGTYFQSKDVSFNFTDPIGGTTTPINTVLESTATGSTSIEWNLFSVTPEMFVYFDILYIFSFYTGPSISFNRGFVSFNADAHGTVVSRNDILAPVGTSMEGSILIPAKVPLATASLQSKTNMSPMFIIPKWTLGLEINLWAFKLQVEVASILTSITESFTAQVGARVQF